MKIIKTGNIAIAEYPPCEDPEFDLDENGVLFIFGYKITFMDKEIRCAKRFQTGLSGYKIIDLSVVGNIDKLLSDHGMDKDNILVMAK